MDWIHLPPLNSLRAFSALADAGSYTRAARQLNVTQAAVSQQVKGLEQRLGIALVARLGRGVELTDAGARLARELAHGFEVIGRGVERISEDAASRPVQVTMTPAFAVEWLLPRMSAFQRVHPEITLLLNPTSQVAQLRPGGTDVAIRYQDRRQPQPDVDSVLNTDMIVIAAPSLVEGLELRDRAALMDLPWLQELGTKEVTDWFAYHGVVPDRPLTVNHMPGNLIMTAVRRGDGVTYTARAFFSEDLAAGRVVELFSEPLFGVYFIETAPAPLRPEARVFLKWLRSQAETVTAASPDPSGP